MNIIFIDTSKDIRDKKEQMLYDLFGFYLKIREEEKKENDKKMVG